MRACSAKRRSRYLFFARVPLIFVVEVTSRTRVSMTQSARRGLSRARAPCFHRQSPARMRVFRAFPRKVTSIAMVLSLVRAPRLFCGVGAISFAPMPRFFFGVGIFSFACVHGFIEVGTYDFCVRGAQIHA